MQKPKNILIARLSSIGDIILATPVIRGIRNTYPDAKISFLVKEEFSSLLKYHPGIDELITFNKSGGFKGLMELRRLISSKQFDCFIDLHNNLRTRFLRISLAFPLSSTYGKDSMKRWLLVKLRLNMLKSSRQVYLKYFDAVKPLGITYDHSGTDIYPGNEAIESVKLKLREAQIDPVKPIIVLSPGASFSNKQWLPERFGEIASQLVSRHSAQVILLGGPGDRALCENIISAIPERVVNLAGKLTLVESAALARLSVVVVSNDSGMMHLAQSQGTAVVAIFGPTSRELGFFPLPNKSMVIENPVPCRPCTTKGLNHCPKGHFNCMKGIDTSRVYEAVIKMSSGQLSSDTQPVINDLPA